jgi:hypothetical protein
VNKLKSTWDRYGVSGLSQPRQRVDRFRLGRLSLSNLSGFGTFETIAEVSHDKQHPRAGIVTYRLSGKQIRDCVRRTIQQVYPATVSTIGFVAMSTVMQQAGMIDFLARHMAAWVGTGFMLVSPIIGGLGGFITGSNSAANAMLAPF